MSRYLLDTNIPSEQIRPRPEPLVVQWLSAQMPDAAFLSVITMGELRKGIALMPPSKRRNEVAHFVEGALVSSFAGRILPVTQAIGDRWGLLSASRQLMGTPLDTADGLIAATALEHDLTVVTRNVKDFADLGLTIVNPWEAT